MATQVISTTSKETRRRRAALESKLEELLGVSQGREDLRIEYLADPLDQVRSITDREMVIQRLDRQARLIRDIKSALAQMDEGAYGLCARCEEPIPRNRLDAVPWARLCVACQSQAETGEHDAGPPIQDAA